MRKADVVSFFGSIPAAAKALGITPHAIYQWDDLVPRGSAYTAQVVSEGKLKVDPALYPPKKKLLDAEIEDSSVKSSTPVNRLTTA